MYDVFVCFSSKIIIVVSWMCCVLSVSLMETQIVIPLVWHSVYEKFCGICNRQGFWASEVLIRTYQYFPLVSLKHSQIYLHLIFNRYPPSQALSSCNGLRTWQSKFSGVPLKNYCLNCNLSPYTMRSNSILLLYHNCLWLELSPTSCF